LYYPEESNDANLELDLSVQLKDAEIRKMTASRKFELKFHGQKLMLGLKPKLKLLVGE
jgi:hypothetical protein